MGWRIATFVLLGLVLAGGFAWYERSRPPSRMVALVAALAALAVAGRLAFAAIPNVQATTDIVLISGYAVGAGPGFAVGALGALISNLWLGQGPWTPWEMAGWGLVGLGGAALAALTGRRLGRLGLAVVCALAGLAYGALLDYSVMATAGGPQTLARYLAISARGVPFNIAHAAGNFALALAAGPALVAIVSRYRTRLEFSWRREWAAPLLAALVAFLAVGAGGGRAAADAPSAWLAQAANADGGFGVGPGSPSSPEMTGWAMLGLEAAGRNPLDLGGGSSPVAYLRDHAGKLGSTGDLERTILALDGAGVNPRGVGGRDLLAQLRARRSRSGAYDGEVNLTAFGILALRSAGEPAGSLDRSRRWLERAERTDGGWGIQPGIPSDPDSTGAALQGLAAAGAGGGTLRRGVAYLRHDQNRDGGWPLAGSGPSNSQSTAWAIQGLIAAGASPSALARGGHSGFDYLAARRAADGHYRYSAASDQTPVWVTGQVLMAVERKALPLAAVPRARHASGKGASRGGGGGGGGGSAPAPGANRVGSAEPGASPGSAAAGAPGETQSKRRARRADRHPNARGGGARSAPSPEPHAPSKPPGGRALPAQVSAAPTATAASASRAESRSAGGASTPTAIYLAIGGAVLALAAAVWWWRRRRSSLVGRDPTLHPK
jgi:energy-coupling factor transport system substrate-specific component